MQKAYIALLTGALLTGPGAASAKPQQEPPQAPTGAQTPTMDAARNVAEYQSQAQGLSSMPADPTHPAEIKALRSLANALDAMPGANEVVKKSTATIRKDADTLEHAPATAVHSDTAKDALTSSLAALDALQTVNEPAGMADKIRTAREQVAKIDPAVPFLKQRATIDRAFVAVGDALALAGGPAVSQEVTAEEKQPVSGEEVPTVAAAPAPKAYPFFQLSVAGGVVDFTENSAKNLTQIGGLWDVRLLVGDSYIIAGEAAYVGTANSVNNVMGQFAPNGSIIGTALEFDVRLQVPRMLFPVRPFGFWGVGWNNYALVNERFRDPAAIESSDNAFVMPFGIGVQYDITERFAMDTRFTFRAMFDENLITTDNNGVPGVAAQGMSQWAWTARLGYTF